MVKKKNILLFFVIVITYQNFIGVQCDFIFKGYKELFM